MPEEAKPGSATPTRKSRTAPPHELDPARSKSVESVEQEVDDIVDALAERERERAQRRRDAPTADGDTLPAEDAGKSRP